MAGEEGWWAADPAGRHQSRYWDGAAWTSWVSDGGPAFRDPLEWTPPAGAAAPSRAGPAVFSRAAVPIALVGIAASVVASRFVVRNVATFSSAPTMGVVMFYVLLYGGLVLTCVIASARFGTGHPRADFGVSWQVGDLGWGLLAFITLLVVTNYVSAALLSVPAIRDSADNYSDRVDAIAGGALGVWLFVGIAVAPVVEEMVFRGLLLRSLIPAVGVPQALVYQSIAFGAYHLSPGLGLYNIVYFVSTATFGLAMGWIATKRDRLGVTITAHAVTNAVLFGAIVATR